LLVPLFEVVDVQSCNFKPHPFTIGPQHLKNSTSIYLDPNCAPCAHRERGTRARCELKYEEHTCDRVVFLKCLKNMTNADAASKLAGVKKQMEKDKLDGFAFIKSEYEIAPPEEEADAENSDT